MICQLGSVLLILNHNGWQSIVYLKPDLLGKLQVNYILRTKHRPVLDSQHFRNVNPKVFPVRYSCPIHFVVTGERD